MSDPRKTIFITGAASGIGAQLARQFAGEGHAVVLAIRNPSRAADLLAELGELAMAVPCEVRDAASVAAAVQTATERFGGLDVVINCAGTVEPIGLIEATDPAAWRSAVETNLVGPYLVARAVVPALRASKGVLINISTGASTLERRAWSAYCSAKAGLAMFTRCAALEFGADGVLVLGVQPGMVDTGMQERIRASGANEVSEIPRERLLPVTAPARALSWLLRNRNDELQGRDLTLADLRTLAGPGADW